MGLYYEGQRFLIRLCNSNEVMNATSSSTTPYMFRLLDTRAFIVVFVYGGPRNFIIRIESETGLCCGILTELWVWVYLSMQASLLGEALTGKGTLAQFDIETGIPLTETEPLLLFFILFTLLGAIGALGDRGKFVDDAPVAGLDSTIIKPGKGVKAALGLNERGK